MSNQGNRNEQKKNQNKRKPDSQRWTEKKI